MSHYDSYRGSSSSDRYRGGSSRDSYSSGGSGRYSSRDSGGRDSRDGGRDGRDSGRDSHSYRSEPSDRYRSSSREYTKPSSRDGGRDNGWTEAPNNYRVEQQPQVSAPAPAALPQDPSFEAPAAPVSTAIDFDQYDDIPVETSGTNCPTPISSWQESNLDERIVRNVLECGYKRPTPVQKYSIPIVGAARDLMSCAQTGSGKTAAFLLPIMNQMLRNAPDRPPAYGKCYPTALVLAPTRELAIQIADEARKFSNRSHLRSMVVYGGSPIGQQLRELERGGGDLLVATPGRLVDIIERGKVSLTNIKFLVLDEADRMLDMGFEPQIRRIVEREGMPRRGLRRTLMFSATFPRDIQQMAASFLDDYIFLTIGRVGSATELITQRFVEVTPTTDKTRLLLELLRECKPQELTLIFVETKRNANLLDMELQRSRYPSTSIHGDRSQQERTAALKSFSSGATPILIATNVAARGLDISNVTHVINYEMPNNIDDYIHRIGRTGRAGKSGVSTSFVSHNKDGNIVPQLVQRLQDNNAEVPPWLLTITKFSGGSSGRGRGGPGRGGANRFGGRDFRSEGRGTSSAPSYPPAQSYPAAGSYGGYSAPQSYGAYPAAGGYSAAPAAAAGGYSAAPPAAAGYQSYGQYPGYPSYGAPSAYPSAYPYGYDYSSGAAPASGSYGAPAAAANGAAPSYAVPLPPSNGTGEEHGQKREREDETGEDDSKKPRY